MLTQHFGICGFGWKTVVDRMWIEPGANGEQTAHVQISLYVRDPETKEWSDAIIGVGGAAFVANEKSGPFTDDDCYKKAYTDAISIACKALGMAADVYYEKDPDSKYTGSGDDPVPPQNVPPQNPPVPFPEAEPIPYEKALTMQYQGVALRDIYKQDRTTISQIYNDPNTPENIKTAIRVINAMINAHNKK